MAAYHVFNSMIFLSLKSECLALTTKYSMCRFSNWLAFRKAQNLATLFQVGILK
jgi:hypothetical protein